MFRFVPPLLAAAAALPPAAAQSPTAAPPPAAALAGDDAAWAPHRGTRVLYAGWKDDSREQAFVPFLQQHFATVGVISLEQLTAATAADYDVVIADWCSQYGNDGYPKRENSLYGVKTRLPASFTKPVIAMDYVSSNLRRDHKLDWL